MPDTLYTCTSNTQHTYNDYLLCTFPITIFIIMIVYVLIIKTRFTMTAASTHNTDHLFNSIHVYSCARARVIYYCCCYSVISLSLSFSTRVCICVCVIVRVCVYVWICSILMIPLCQQWTKSTGAVGTRRYVLFKSKLEKEKRRREYEKKKTKIEKSDDCLGQ